MNFLHINSQKEAGEILAKRLEGYLNKDQKVLWLLSGGSNLSISVEALKILKKNCSSVTFLPGQLSLEGQEHHDGSGESTLKHNLAVMLTDERYGKVGHPDSNWQQLLDAGFDMDLVQGRPILGDISIEETVDKFSQNFKELSVWADVTIAQFGIGSDGHTAGVLPKTSCVSATGIACVGEIYPHNESRKPGKFTRISLTLETIKRIPIAYTFAFGAAKKEVVNSLQEKDISLNAMPAQVLKLIAESYLYTDQI